MHSRTQNDNSESTFPFMEQRSQAEARLSNPWIPSRRRILMERFERQEESTVESVESWRTNLDSWYSCQDAPMNEIGIKRRRHCASQKCGRNWRRKRLQFPCDCFDQFGDIISTRFEDLQCNLIAVLSE